MIEKDEFSTLYEEALERVMERGKDGNDLTEVFAEMMAEERRLKWAREVIEKAHQERSNKDDQ